MTETVKFEGYVRKHQSPIQFGGRITSEKLAKLVGKKCQIIVKPLPENQINAQQKIIKVKQKGKN